jgi:hypothetical protein
MPPCATLGHFWPPKIRLWGRRQPIRVREEGPRMAYIFKYIGSCTGQVRCGMTVNTGLITNTNNILMIRKIFVFERMFNIQY